MTDISSLLRNGISNKKGVTSQLIEKGNTEGIDAVSGATCTSKAILDACETPCFLQKDSKKRLS